MIGYTTYSPTLIEAVRAQRAPDIQASLMMIHMLDGDEGLRAALLAIADMIAARVPSPEPGEHYSLQATTLRIDDDGVTVEEHLPYEVQWTMGVLAARLNGHTEEIRQLISTASADRRLGACSMTLAALAGRADDFHHSAR
jgi:hypothetical protein